MDLLTINTNHSFWHHY